MAATTARKNFIPLLFVDLQSTGVPNVLHQQCIVDDDLQCIVPVCFDSQTWETFPPVFLVSLLT